MPKITDEPIEVRLQKRRGTLRPISFRWRGRWYSVQVLEAWSEVHNWWDQGKELRVWRVKSAGGGVFELAQDQNNPSSWRLVAIFD